MASPTRIMDAWRAVVNTSTLPGDIVEVGVYKGGTAMVMAWAELAMAARAPRPSLVRKLWLFDTFEGLPPPGRKDDTRAHNKWRAIRVPVNETAKFLKGEGYIDANGATRWNYGPLELVSANVNSTGYPPNRVRFVKGKVEETLIIESNLPNKISVLRLDTDFYSSTVAELSVLFPRLVPGGVLIIDDYCTWGGARVAFDEFFAKNREKLIYLQTSGEHCLLAQRSPI